MTTRNPQQALSPEQLYHACDLGKLSFSSTEELEPLAETIGQERALEAVEFSMGMPHDGFNVYVMGSSGLGRHTLVKQALTRQSEDGPSPSDWCYVANFHQPHVPAVLRVPAGTGRSLRRDMERLVDDLLNAVPASFQGDEYQRRSKEILSGFQQKQDQAASRLGKKAASLGIGLVHEPDGVSLIPLKGDEGITPEEFDKLPDEEKEKIEEATAKVKEDLKETMSHIPEWQREMRQRFRDLNRETAEITVAQFISALEKDYTELPDVLAYLVEVRQDIIENIDVFRQSDAGEPGGLTARDPGFMRYQVNVLVDNAEQAVPPVVVEDNPTYQNLLGRIEHLAHMGTLQTNFTLIKPGALHRANGGYLVLDAEKVLTNPFAWDGLKRSIRAREIRIESLERQLSLVSTISLEPQPIPIDVKIVLVGSRLLYYLLKEYDPEFELLFKVTADFSEVFDRDGESEALYARLIATLQQRETLRPITQDGVALIIEQAARRAGDGEKLSLHMGRLIDLLKEADFVAEKVSSKQIRAEDVQAAIDAQVHRANQLQEQLREAMLKGTIRIQTDGLQLAQVNGLSVMQLGNYAFGAPTRISATARIGSGDVIDIEREIQLGGPVHSKGVLILSSYLGERYAKHQPLSMSASLVFEQTYGEIEGDSASAAELCALLSAIGDIPIRQSIAITGSINQHGEVQAVGGVSQKIEGFFDLCDERGLSGDQGVIIPASNIKDLMLRADVLEAARAGKFQIYAVDHIEQAMELLTGMPAGMPDAGGIFPEGTINWSIQLRLAEWTSLRQQYASPVRPEPEE
jgi:lon-related putative ATP-dependent protease